MSSAILVFGGHHRDAQGVVAADGRTEYNIVRDVFLWRLQDAIRILGSPGVQVPRTIGGIIPWKASEAFSHARNGTAIRVALDLHLNSSVRPEVKGLRICHHDTASSDLLRASKTLASRLGGISQMLEDSRDGFAEHMEKFGIPALVIELAFVTNPADLAAAEREAGERMIDMARALLQVFPPGP